MDKNRKTAYSTLLEIERNQAFSNIELNRQIKEQEPDSPAFVRELVYGVLETKRYLDYVLSQLIPKGLKGVKKQTLTLLRMGLYQILYMDSVPDYAAVSETVKLARRLIPGRDGFVNGVLRGYGKKAGSIKMPDRERDSVRYFGIRYSYADWIVKQMCIRDSICLGQKKKAYILTANRCPKKNCFSFSIKSRILSFVSISGSISMRMIFMIKPPIP